MPFYRDPRRYPTSRTPSFPQTKKPRSPKITTNKQRLAKKILEEFLKRLKSTKNRLSKRQKELILLSMISESILKKLRIKSKATINFFNEKLGLTLELLNAIKERKKDFNTAKNEFVNALKHEISQSESNSLNALPETEKNNFLSKYFDSVFDLQQEIERIQKLN